MTVRDELKYLLEKHLDDHLSEEENARFQFLLSQDANRQLIADLIESVLARRRAPAVTDPDKQQIFSAVMQQAEARASARPGTQVLSARRRQLSRWIPYAAVIALFLCAGAWFFSGSRRGSAPQDEAHGSAAVQANSKVVLTLGDGSRIALDEAKQGLLESESGVDIVKSAQGGVTYSPRGAAGSADTACYNSVTTLRGGQYQVTLPDGTRVWLNAVSSLRFPVSFSGKTRTVSLTGEAYFEVARDASKPFIVKAGSLDVNVLGTHFNIMAYKDEKAVETTLLEGSVELSCGAGQVVLKPGQQGSLSRHGGGFTVSRPDIEQVMAWKNGEFRFKNADVATIMRQFARWYDLSVAYQGDISDIKLSGVLSKKQDVSQLLEVLETTHKIHFNVEGDTITVVPAPDK